MSPRLPQSFYSTLNGFSSVYETGISNVDEMNHMFSGATHFNIKSISRIAAVQTIYQLEIDKDNIDIELLFFKSSSHFNTLLHLGKHIKISNISMRFCYFQNICGAKGREGCLLDVQLSHQCS